MATPMIRFNGFDEDWVRDKLIKYIEDGSVSLGRGRVIAKSKLKDQPSDRYKYPVYSSSVENNGLMGYDKDYDIEDTRITWSIDGGGTLFHRNNHKYSVTNVSGIMTLNMEVFDYKFVGEYLDDQRSRIDFDYLHKAHPSVINTLYNLPRISLEEQEKIGEFFKLLDELISAEEEQLAQYEQYKASMLQKLFPKKGETNPEIRFDGFNEDWDSVEIKSLLNKGTSGGTPNTSKSEYYNGEIPFLTISDIRGRNIEGTEKYITEEGLNNSSAKLLPKNTVALAMYASVGRVGIMKKPMSTSQAFYNMEFDEYLIDYVFTYLEMMDMLNMWRTLIGEGTQKNLNATKVRDYKIRIPGVKVEIEMIGQFFKTLDDQIEAQQQQVDNLKETKESFLQKMFV